VIAKVPLGVIGEAEIVQADGRGIESATQLKFTLLLYPLIAVRAALKVAVCEENTV
jgi:hypothetical protein